MHPALATLLLLQLPVERSATTPPSRDTVGYWQQRVRYEIVGRLDEARAAVRARATLTYVNNSPDTLRELYVHQYLNAFRPGSAWSAADQRERRVRFQQLEEPHFAYERFTETTTVDGVGVTPEYPGGADSTVVRFALPHPLSPGDSLRAEFAWEARPSTVPRRQGRRGRHFDFAQWFPKVAVYDRGGWEPRALVPAGEFYGEFGDYDVTLVVRDDQVLGATGVPVAGDPGWSGALKCGAVQPTGASYGGVAAQAPSGDSTPLGYKRVRFVARDVHHFAWSASPDYRYEGGVYVRPAGVWPQRFPTWDTVAVHVLYRPGDERQWGGGRAVERTKRALRWLEDVYGAYGYPQVTNLHRLDGGGTEFPMMMMNGSASQGLVLHELGHVYTFGMLANNEWRSGWMDEGLTEYQTEWAQGLTAHDHRSASTPLDSLLASDSGGTPDARPAFSARPGGYGARALRPAPAEASRLQQIRYDILGRAEPIGTPGDRFSEFAIYNSMIYDRAALMYGALRDVLGDDAFRAFLRGYYARWAFRHVDEAAMRAEAERAAGRDLGWFFEQWVHRTGLVDYQLRRVRSARDGDAWLTRARVVRRGEYRHPPAVGVRTDDGRWTIVQGDALARDQTVEVRTAARPRDVRLDPLDVTPDWYGPNDVRVGLDGRGSGRVRRHVFDWPFLDQAEADRYLVATTPVGWLSRPGHATLGLRTRANYQGTFDRVEAGVVYAVRRAPERAGVAADRDAWPAHGRLQFWTTVENPRLGRRPLVGFSFGSWTVDGIQRLDLRQSRDLSRFLVAPGVRASASLGFTGTYPHALDWVDPARWSGRSTSDLTLGYAARTPGTSPTALRVGVTGGVVSGHLPSGASAATKGFVRATGELSRLRRSTDWRWVTFGRAFAAWVERAPLERQVYASSRSPTETFSNHFLRPWGSPLAAPDAHYVALGGAGLRGFDPRLAVGSVLALNAEQSLLLRVIGPTARPLRLFASAFADAGQPLGRRGGGRADALADAGVGLALRGQLYDREVRARLDFPLYVSRPALAVGGEAGDSRGRPRVAFSFDDLW